MGVSGISGTALNLKSGKLNLNTINEGCIRLEKKLGCISNTGLLVYLDLNLKSEKIGSKN